MNSKDKTSTEVKERYFNYRPLCVVLAFLVLGCLFAFYITRNTIMTSVVACIILIAVIIISVIYKKLKYVIVPIIAFVIGLSAYFITVASFEKVDITKPDTITARIYNVNNSEDGVAILYADSCIFDGRSVNENIKIYLYDNSNMFENIKIGAVVTFAPTNFYKTNLFFGDIPDAYSVSKNIKHTVTASINNLEYHYTDTTLAEKIKQYIKNNLANGLNNENVELAYSALFGDKTNLSSDFYSAYKLSGIAHLLAVSGLHVGIITGILYKLLDKLKIKRWGRVIIVGLFLLAYMYICNFSVSVVRATIMCLVMMMSPLFYRQYDSLSAISLAGIIIFMINPLNVFDVSTLMSFSCAFGITLLYKPLARVLSNTKLPKSIVDGLSLSIATTISLMLVMAYFFKTLNLISIVANIIIIPIFTLAFSIIFVLSMLSLIFPLITHLLVFINPILNLIALIAGVLGNLPIANFTTIRFEFIGIIVFFLILLIMSRICVAKPKDKVFLTLPLLALLILCLV